MLLLILMFQLSPHIFISLVLRFSVIWFLSDLTPLDLTPKNVPLPAPGSGRATPILLLLEKWDLLYQVICSKSKLESLMPPFALLPCMSGSAVVKYSSTTPGPKRAPSSRRMPWLSLCSLKDILTQFEFFVLISGHCLSVQDEELPSVWASHKGTKVQYFTFAQAANAL